MDNTESRSAVHEIARREEWLPLRLDLFARDKELTRMRDKLAEQRRQLPWVVVEKEYRFNGPDGELGPRHQLGLGFPSARGQHQAVPAADGLVGALALLAR